MFLRYIYREHFKVLNFLTITLQKCNNIIVYSKLILRKIDPDLKTINASAKIQDLQVFKGTDGKGTSETSFGYSGVSRVGWTDWGACRTLIKLNNFSFATYKISNSWQIESAYNAIEVSKIE